MRRWSEGSISIGHLWQVINERPTLLGKCLHPRLYPRIAVKTQK